MQKAIHSYPLLRLRSAASLLAVLLALVLSGTAAWAQSTQGSIVGTVKDSKGAIIPGALVTLTNTDESVSRTTKTNESGEYSFQDAKAAHYTVNVEAPGFQKWQTAGVVLEVRQQLRLDATVAIGSVQQEVTVNADRSEERRVGKECQ